VAHGDPKRRAVLVGFVFEALSSQARSTRNVQSGGFLISTTSRLGHGGLDFLSENTVTFKELSSELVDRRLGKTA
jgi:hypothetical protein